MPDKVIDVPGIGPTAFPEDMSDDDIAKAIKPYFDESAPAPQKPAAAPVETSAPDSMGKMGGREMATGAAYGMSQLPSALPAIGQGAQFVAKTPAAQKLIARGIGAAAGEMLGGPAEALVGTVMGGPLSASVGKVAGKVASGIQSSASTRAFTMQQAVKGTAGVVGRNPATGQFTKILPSALKGVIEKLGPAMGMMSGESAALENLNDPAKLKAFIAKLSPEEKAKLFRQMPASFAKEYQD